MDTLGLDEAGRGPVLGPMVVAGIVIPEKKEKIIERMGVKDSKRLTPNRRTVLYRKLTKMFDYEIVVVTAKDIDTLRAKGINLNQIEKLAMQKIINNLRADRIIIDALDVKEGRLQEEMEEYVGHTCEVIAEHKADDIRSTKDRAGIGSGYPSDPKTKDFLKKFKYDEMPDFVRRSWGTVQKIKEAEEAEKLE